MNLLAGTASDGAKDSVYHVAVGDRTTLNTLFDTLKNALANNGVKYSGEPINRDFRSGDVAHSQADISKANHLLGYSPLYRIYNGIEVVVAWYIEHFAMAKN